MKVLVHTKNLSRQEWLQYRTQGIGGSDVSVIAGINPYRSVYQLWLEKTGQITPEETENEYTQFGTLLEPIVRKVFTQKTGIKVRKKNMLLQSEEYPFMLANLDGVIRINGEFCLFEAKTASAYKSDEWKNGIPQEYLLQIQHYMAVTGAIRTYIAVIIGGNHFEYRIIERDDKMIADIIAMEKQFWEVNVIGGVEPLPDGLSITSDYLNQRYCMSNGKTVILPSEIILMCEKYSLISDSIDKLSTEKEMVCNRIKSSLKENEIGVAGDYKISWKQINSTRFNQTKFKAENPELYSKYVMQSCYRRFNISQEGTKWGVST